jgi:hypothetical protein
MNMTKAIKKIRAKAETAVVETVTAKPAKRTAKAKAAKPVKAPKVAKVKPISKRAELLAQCEAGKVPAAPDFSAATHARFRKRLAEIVALVEAGDVKGLKAMRDSINPISTSPKAMVRYATLAIIALEASAKAAKGKAA